MVKPALFLLALTPLAAPLLAATHPMAALILHDFFSRLCHQNPERSFIVNGTPIAVCVRCLGIYTGVAVATLQSLKKPLSVNLFLVATALNLLDVATETLRWHGSMPLPRFLLGLALGLATGSILFGAHTVEDKPATPQAN